VVGHGNPGTLAPDFSTLRDLAEGLVERTESSFEVFFGLAAGVLELDQGSPEPTCGEVDRQRLVDEVFCELEVAAANLE
jgi:hypothetical protein